MNVCKVVFYYIPAIITVGGLACTDQNRSSFAEKVQGELDSLRAVYAPDKRVALWDISLDDANGVLILNGEVDAEKAYGGINKFISEKYPHIKNQVRLLPESGNGQLVTALVNNSVANLRSEPRHSAEIATQALLGTPIRILKKKGSWILVQTPNRYIAWVDDAGITQIDKSELEKYRSSPKIIYSKPYGFSYSKPDDKSQTVSDLVIGCLLPVVDAAAGFYKVQYPDKREAWVKKGEAIDANAIFSKTLAGSELENTAMKFLGIPYLWGGTSSKAVDCSGFTSTVYYLNGTIIQRDASQQTKYGKEITTTYDYHDLQPGDLLFFGRRASDSLPEKVTHVAMYIGNTEFIHASGKVRINSMDSTRGNFVPEYPPLFVRAVRVLHEDDGNGIQKILENSFYKEIINQ